MNYPLISEYIEAIKAAEDNFGELTNLRPVFREDGQPVMTSGNFAVVFKMKDEATGKLYALKCFTKEQEGRAEAYHQIAEELKDVLSPYLVSIRYLEKELFVDTYQTDVTEFPILLMDWVEGKTLDKYLRENIDDKYALEMLAYRFSQLAQWLIPQPFAHGDLKPDNILVRDDGTLVLVDYDGMYVPAMKWQKARELGSPDFRHPLRTENDFDEHIDDFPLVSILLSLKAISVNPLWLKEYGAADRLLLSEKDNNDIKSCKFFKNCMPSGNKAIDGLFLLFIKVYYDAVIPLTYHRLFHLNRPILLVPFKISESFYTLYDRINSKMLPLQYTYIDFVDKTLKTSSSCIIKSDGMFSREKAAIISHPSDLTDVHWYKQILYIGKIRTRFIVKDEQNRYGVISDDNAILLDLVFQEIKTIEVGEEVYLICKKDNYYGMLNKQLKVVIPCILMDLYEYSHLKLIVYKNERNSIFVMDLNTLKECIIPSDYNRIEDYREGILTFMTADGQCQFYSFEKEDYINFYTYQKIINDCIKTKDKHVSLPNPNNCQKKDNVQDENQYFINFIKEKYLNSTYISNFNKLEIYHQCCYFTISDLGGIAFVSYHWENGCLDEEDYYGYDINLGYADEDMCYWAKDCMINQI